MAKLTKTTNNLTPEIIWRAECFELLVNTNYNSKICFEN